MQQDLPLQINLPALRGLHRFGDIYEQAIGQTRSELVKLTPDRAAPDCIGPHWYGMRCHMVCTQTAQQFYLHTGLIFLPETRTGLMVELDRNNNAASYEQVWNHIQPGEGYEINKDEAPYLKLFMPDADFARLATQDRKQQAQQLAAYLLACAEAIARAAYTEGFCLAPADLANTLGLAKAFRHALETDTDPGYTVTLNPADPDNFGQYASGYRYHLQDSQTGHRMYAYFGAIYSYKKEPAGVFAEIDWLNNQQDFDRAFAHMPPSPLYRFSNKEPKFIKLFLPDERAEQFNHAPPAQQAALLQEFLHACNKALVQAARGEG